MPLIQDEIADELRQEFEALEAPVRLAVFSQALVDPASEQVKRLVEELAAFSPKLSVESHNFVLDKEAVATLGISRTPAIAVLGDDRDYGVRFYGQPAGYEFGTLVEAILDVSRGTSGLGDETRQALAALEAPVHLQVFSTPT